MKIIKLEKKDHNYKTGDTCGAKKPNLKEDSIFEFNGKIIGFFIKKISPKMQKVANFADQELRSKRVPKSIMNRSSSNVAQFSTIIGAIPKKHHLGRHYVGFSSVHRQKSAQNFIRAMKYLAFLSEEKIKKNMPDQYEIQKNILSAASKKELNLCKLFTSSISNFNISAPFHQDNGNLKNTVNVIINKKFAVTGGNLFVPDFDLVFDGCDNSMIVYPAWMSLHAVTPIIQNKKNGYRNSLVFYPYDLSK